MTQTILGEVDLQHVQVLEGGEHLTTTQHAVPALEGDFVQRHGRELIHLALQGVLAGPEAQQQLDALREQFRTADPLPFVADIATATRVGEVLIEGFDVRELAGYPERFAYSLALLELIPPPEAETVPPEIIPPPPPAPDTGTLVVEVTVEGQPDFDFSTVIVMLQSAPSQSADGAPLSTTLRSRVANVWTEGDLPPAPYAATAVVAAPALSGSASATVRAGQTTRLQIVLRPGVVTATTFTVHFRFDRAFVEPCMRPVLRQVVEYARAHSDEKMLIIGHTDKTGSDAYNQSLSDRRARAVFAALTFGRARDAALVEWNQLRMPRPAGELPSIKDNWGTREYQHMLQDLGYYAGLVNGEHDNLTDAAVRAFQQERRLGVDGVVGDATWPALIEAYLAQDGLAVPVTQFLPNARNGCDGGSLQWLGCGEQDPVRNTQDAWRPNRRVEVLFVTAPALPREVAEPVTFRLPTPGAVNPSWCLGPGNPDARCCFLVPASPAEGAQPGPDQWRRVPAETERVVVRGSMKFDDGSPGAGVRYALIAPDGEFMDGERPSGSGRGEPVLGRTDAEGAFTYRDRPKGTGIFVLEIQDRVVARLKGEAPEAGKGAVLCARLSGGASLEVILSPVRARNPLRTLRGVIHDRFGRIRPRTRVDAFFGDGSTLTAETDDDGRFVMEMTAPHESAAIRYNLSDDVPPDVFSFVDVFVDPKPIDTDEGIRRRLHNLGHLVGDDVADALTRFQATHGLDTTGEADDETRARLAAVHDGEEPAVPEFESADEPLRDVDLIGEGPPP